MASAGNVFVFPSVVFAPSDEGRQVPVHCNSASTSRDVCYGAAAAAVGGGRSVPYAPHF